MPRVHKPDHQQTAPKQSTWRRGFGLLELQGLSIVGAQAIYLHTGDAELAAYER